MSVRFVTAAALVHELMEARDERRLLRLQKQLANHKLLILDLCGVPSYVESAVHGKRFAGHGPIRLHITIEPLQCT